jgi:hypothetical protein
MLLYELTAALISLYRRCATSLLPISHQHLSGLKASRALRFRALIRYYWQKGKWHMQTFYVLCLSFGLISAAQADTVFDKGTVFVDTGIIASSDPTAFVGLTYIGFVERKLFDRRVGWLLEDVFVFEASYDDGGKAEVQVNPEFGSRASAEEQALFFATEIGRLPSVLRDDMETVWIHKGDKPFGGGNNNFLIHVGHAAFLMRDLNALHETLAHEGVHTSLDETWANAPAWRAAQEKDGAFISPYARDNPETEDLAETFLMWMASRYVPQRVDADVLARAEEGNAARFAFFDSLNLDMSPFMPQR